MFYMYNSPDYCNSAPRCPSCPVCQSKLAAEHLCNVYMDRVRHPIPQAGTLPLLVGGWPYRSPQGLPGQLIVQGHDHNIAFHRSVSVSIFATGRDETCVQVAHTSDFGIGISCGVVDHDDDVVEPRGTVLLGFQHRSGWVSHRSNSLQQALIPRWELSHHTEPIVWANVLFDAQVYSACSRQSVLIKNNPRLHTTSVRGTVIFNSNTVYVRHVEMNGTHVFPPGYVSGHCDKHGVATRLPGYLGMLSGCLPSTYVDRDMRPPIF